MKTEFIVITNGKDVAGQRNPGVGSSILLTEEQARHPLRTRQVRRPGDILAEPAVDVPAVIEVAPGDDAPVEKPSKK